jgi:hypothetical protein
MRNVIIEHKDIRKGVGKMKKCYSLLMRACLIVSLCISVSLIAGSTSVYAATIKLSQKSSTLVVGQKKTLKVKGTKKKVAWSSSKKSTVTVNKNGVITAKKKGSATITAKVAGKTLKCKVKVENPYLNETSQVVLIGKSVQLKLNGTKQKVSWSSKNSTVATVDKNGLVKGMKAGNTTITATVSGVKYTCDVKVISLADNYAKLKSFIQKKGTLDDEGNLYIQGKLQYDDVDAPEYLVAICRVTYLNSDQYKFEYSVKIGTTEKLLCCMYVNVEKSNKATVEIEYLSTETGDLIATSEFDAGEYSLFDDVEFNISKNTLKDMDKEDAQDLCSLELMMGCSIWDMYLGEHVGIGLEDLGFVNIESLGSSLSSLYSGLLM